MNEKEKQLYEILKETRNYLLKRIDILQNKINQEYEYIDIDIDCINECIQDIQVFQNNIHILEQRGDSNNIIGLLNNLIEDAGEDIELSKISKNDSDYCMQKTKDKIMLHISKIKEIDSIIEIFLNKFSD